MGDVDESGPGGGVGGSLDVAAAPFAPRPGDVV